VTTEPDWTDRRERYLHGALRPSEVLAIYIQRASHSTDELQPFQEYFARSAMDQGRIADHRYRDDVARPLEGLFVAIKDLVAVEGVPRRGGTPALRSTAPGRDAAIVSKLRDLGAIPIATARTYELGLSMDNPELGIARNPRDVHRMPGGSSSGSAVAVAAGLVDAAVGTDTAGSIRLPAAWCGVVGYKPKLGGLPMEGVLGLAPSFDTVGFLGLSVRDLLAVRTAIKRSSWDHAQVRSARVAVDETTLDQSSSAVRNAVSDAVDQLGMHVSRIRLPDPSHITEPFWRIVQHEAVRSNAGRLDELLARGGALADQLRAGAAVTSKQSRSDWASLRKYAASARDVMREADVLLMPGPPGSAPRFDDGLVATAAGPRHWHDVVLGSMIPASLLGLAALAVPTLATDSGLPLGLQLVATRADMARESVLWELAARLDSC
jgi:aspartyl-tRNA(Asn)/glutamyl-tRNA(Gln) amidotransferase subunit A